MADEPDNLVLVMLREMRGEIRELSDRVGKLKGAFELRLGHVEKQLEYMRKIATCVVGQCFRGGAGQGARP
jgi:hypothetical protein